MKKVGGPVPLQILSSLFGDTHDLPDIYPTFTKLQLVEMRDMLNTNLRFFLCEAWRM